MARYIDADKIDYKFIMVGMDENAGYRAVAFESDIDEIPTADVVPKSEYDAVVSAVDNSTKEFLKLHDAYQNAKAEVARDIIGIIDKRMELKTEQCEGIHNGIVLSVYRGQLDAYRDVKEIIEQKYGNTEDNMDKGRCRHSICQEARQEVAREIFEEIEELLKRTCEKGYCGSISDLLAELKKKYTGEET